MEQLSKLVFLVLYVFFTEAISPTKSSDHRAGKFLSFFQIVTFQNQPCTTKDGSNESTGVCYSSWECSEREGGERGNYASGFGRCCVIKNMEDK